MSGGAGWGVGGTPGREEGGGRTRQPVPLHHHQCRSAGTLCPALSYSADQGPFPQPFSGGPSSTSHLKCTGVWGLGWPVSLVGLLSRPLRFAQSRDRGLGSGKKRAASGWAGGGSPSCSIQIPFLRVSWDPKHSLAWISAGAQGRTLLADSLPGPACPSAGNTRTKLPVPEQLLGLEHHPSFFLLQQVDSKPPEGRGFPG